MKSSHKPNNSRLVGLDLARGLAVIGMVLVNFVYIFSHDFAAALATQPELLARHGLFDQGVVLFVLVGLAGRAASLFLVLFGIGLALQARRDVNWPGPQWRRFALLIAFGYLLMTFWEADILHFIGLYGLLLIAVSRWRARWLVFSAVLVLLAAELARGHWDYATGWRPGEIGAAYADLWSGAGQLRQLLINGYHPLLPWLALPLWGLVLGGLDLRDGATLKRMLGGGLSAAALGFGLQAAGVPAEFFPAHTLFILLGLANATWVLGACLLATRINAPGRTIQGLASMGRLALTHYPGHIVLGVVPVLVMRQDRADLSFGASFCLALVYLTVTGVGGWWWLKHHPQGPLERALRVAAAKK